MLTLILAGAGAVEAQVVTSIAIVVAPMDRIAFTGAPAMQDAGSALRTAGPAQSGTAAQDLCATTRNEDPAWLLRPSSLSITRAASVAGPGNVRTDPRAVTCTLVAP